MFDPAGFITLWALPEALEEAFDANWERWLDNASTWTEFFEQLEALPPRDLPGVLQELAVVSDQDLQTFSALQVLPNTRSVSLPLEYKGTETDLALLALAFSLGHAGSLVVPYLKRFAS